VSIEKPRINRETKLSAQFYVYLDIVIEKNAEKIQKNAYKSVFYSVSKLVIAFAISVNRNQKKRIFW